MIIDLPGREVIVVAASVQPRRAICDCINPFASFSVVISVIGARLDKRKWEAFESKFPQISNEEYLERSSPEVTPEVALKVRATMARNLSRGIRVHSSFQPAFQGPRMLSHQASEPIVSHAGQGLV